jgi:hypothetical protein
VVADGKTRNDPSARCALLSSCGSDFAGVLQWEAFGQHWLCCMCYEAAVEERDSWEPPAEAAEEEKAPAGEGGKRGRAALVSRKVTPCDTCGTERLSALCAFTRKWFCPRHFNNRGLALEEIFWRDVRVTERGSVLRVSAFWINPTLSLSQSDT